MSLKFAQLVKGGVELSNYNFNCVSGKWGNFDKRTPETTKADFAYDYDSIMHYGPYFFRCSEVQNLNLTPVEA